MNSMATALVLSGLGIPVIALRRWNNELTGHNLLSTHCQGVGWRIVKALWRLGVTIIVGTFAGLWSVFLTVGLVLLAGHFFGKPWIPALACVLTAIVLFCCVMSWRKDPMR